MEKEKYMIGQELIEIFEKVLKTENISVARKTGCDLSMTDDSIQWLPLAKIHCTV